MSNPLPRAGTFVGVVVCCVTVAAPLLQAQVNGVVLVGGGLPLAAVLVEAWNGAVLIGETRSAPNGGYSFTVAAVPSIRGLSLTFRKIGFRPGTSTVGKDGVQPPVTLQALPARLDQVQVTAERERRIDVCSRKPSAEASTIFARAASRYRHDTPELDRLVRIAAQRRLVHAMDREQVTGTTREVGFQHWFDHRGRGTLSDEQKRAFPFPVPWMKTGVNGAPTGWAYPEFDMVGTAEFVLPWFVDSMPRSIVSNDAGGIVIGFCPRHRRPPYTSGEITLATDTTIVGVRWQFAMPERSQETGGMALFAPPESKLASQHLLPTASVTWTKVRESDRYESTEYSFGRWLVAERGSNSLRLYEDSIRRSRQQPPPSQWLR